MGYAEHTNSCLNISPLFFFKFRLDISKQYITFATNIKSEL